jgi:hypothetical protein
MTKNERSELLQHALIGYQAQYEEIGKRIVELRRRLGLHAPQSQDGGAAAIKPVRRKPRISKAGRQRIAAAMRERWRKARAAGRATLG